MRWAYFYAHLIYFVYICIIGANKILQFFRFLQTLAPYLSDELYLTYKRIT